MRTLFIALGVAATLGLAALAFGAPASIAGDHHAMTRMAEM